MHWWVTHNFTNDNLTYGNSPSYQFGAFVDVYVSYQGAYMESMDEFLAIFNYV